MIARLVSMLGLKPDPRAQLRAIDAVEDTPRRPPVVADTRHIDQIYDQSRVDRFVTAARDGDTNNTAVQWAINKHLDFVSSFTFRSTESDPGLKTEMEAFIRERSRPARCDASGRFGRKKLMRFIESQATVEADCLEVLVKGQGSELVSADCIRTPDGKQDGFQKGKGGWVKGVRIDGRGQPIEYAIHRRTMWNGYELVDLVPASACRLRGYFRSYRQWRGLSPIACAINDFSDLYTNKQLAMAKAKISQYFAVKWKLANAPIPGVNPVGAAKDTATAAGTTPGYNLKLNGAGIASTQVYDGDDFEFMTADTPGTSFLELHRVVVDLCVKALDIPYSFFDEAWTNYVGAQGARQLYAEACRDKRADNAEHLNWWSSNVFTDGVLTSEFDLPSGRTLDSLKYEWVAAGVPYWDRGKRIEAARNSVSMSLSNLEEEAREEGGDVYDNIDANERVLKYAAARGVPIDLGNRPAAPMFEIPAKSDQEARK